MLRIDDIPQQVADDIHAFGVIIKETGLAAFAISERREKSVIINLFWRK